MRNLWNDNTGQDLVEYSLVVAVLALALLSTLSQLTHGISSLYTNMTGRLTGVEWPDR